MISLGHNALYFWCIKIACISAFLDMTIQIHLKWATEIQNQQNDLCAQRRLRSAWASTQSDQSSLSAWRSIGSLATHKAPSEDSGQIGQMARLIWVFAGRMSYRWLSCAAAQMEKRKLLHFLTFEQVTIIPSQNRKWRTASQWCMRVFNISPVRASHTLKYTTALT